MKFWKIKREARRICLQAARGPDWLFAPMRRWAHDRRKSSRIRTGAGALPMQDNVAVFLIYQPRGLLDSALETCRYLTRNGYAVVPVSNAPLTEADRAKLLAECHALIERPNLGYDFGGYRDGVQHVLASGWQPENLLVMNDSVWFPVLADSDFLQRVKDQPADAYGPVMSGGHLQSYMYNFKRRLVLSPFFAAYWRGLPLYNNKAMVIDNCEKRFSVQIEQAGFSVDWYCSSTASVPVIHQMSDEDLATVVDYDRESDGYIARAFANVIPGQADWRARALEAYDVSLSRRYVLKSHPLVLLRDLQVPVLKKDRSPPYVRQRKALCDSTLPTRLEASARSEISAWDNAPR